MKNIIITCGTSILNGKIIDNNDLKSKIDEIEEIEKEKDYKNIIEYYSNNDYKKLKSTKKITNYGAEINILKKVYENGDNIFLFFSETNGGKIVKDILKGYFKTEYAKKLYKDENFEIKDENFIEIEGFKVDDSNEFQEKAIPNFFKELEKIKNKFNIECNLTSFNDITKKTKIETIMCPVGGYKALIPYSSLYAMVNGWDIKYLYEDSDKLIDLKNGILGYLSIKSGINDDDFKDVIEELEKGNNSIFTQDIDFNFTNILIESTNRFIELGDLSGFSKLKTEDKKLQELIDILSEMDIQLKLLGLRKENFKKVINTLEKINEMDNNIYSPIFNKIKNELLKYFSSSTDEYDEKNDLEFYFSCLTFYHDKKRISEEFLFFREFVVDIVQFYIYGEIKYKKFKHPDGVNKTIKKDIRQYIEGSIHYSLSKNIDKKDNFYYITNIPNSDYKKDVKDENSIKLLLKEFKNDIKILNNLRNDIAHFSNLQYDNTFNIIPNYNKEKSLLYNQKIISTYFYNKLNILKENVLTKKQLEN